jgi:hypothetical protein
LCLFWYRNRYRYRPIPILKVSVILQAAIGIFFENGQSKFGFAKDVEFDLANFNMEKVDVLRDNDGVENPFTIQGYFQCYKLSKARIYLISKDKTITEVTNSETEVGCAICLHIAVYASEKYATHIYVCMSWQENCLLSF